MKNKFALLLALVAIAGCRKSNDHSIASKEFSYSGASDVLSEGWYNMQVLRTGDFTCFRGRDFFTAFWQHT